MNALGLRIKTLIEETGPISVSTYMALCLMDPEDGYYTQATPFGRDGDFITAPEISQMFGELIGAWVITTHREAKINGPWTLAEFGPGQGTLMADMLRTIRQIAPDIFAHLHVHLLEASPKLRDKQRDKLMPFDKQIHFVGAAGDLPAQPTIIIANEFFDALPIRQFISVQGKWHERLIGWNGKAFTFQPAPLPVSHAQDLPTAHQDGDIAEQAPASLAIMQTLSAHIKAQGGAALIIDYGHLKSGLGDTLQAVANHQYAPLLEAQGEADLTAHIDFEALTKAAQTEGCTATSETQGSFLLRLGLLERAGQLGAGKTTSEQETIRDAVERLAGPEQMGTLFKVLMVM